MSDDSSLRDFTSERAYNLSMVAKEISEKKSYENFELLYYDYDIDVAMDLHESRGGERWQLIARISTSIIFLQILIFKKVKREHCQSADFEENLSISLQCSELHHVANMYLRGCGTLLSHINDDILKTESL